MRGGDEKEKRERKGEIRKGEQAKGLRRCHSLGLRMVGQLLL